MSESHGVIHKLGQRRMQRSASLLRAAEPRLVFASGCTSAFFFVIAIYYSVRSGNAGWDFYGAPLEAATKIRAGDFPYPPADPAYLSRHSDVYGYPPPLALMVLPLTFLPPAAAYAVWTTVMASAAVGSLRIAGVRDWRCYLIALTSVPVGASLVLGQVTPLLALTVAIGWRLRRRVLGALVLALGIAIKPLAWPLLLWLTVTRRAVPALAAACFAAVVILVSWAVIGFAGFGSYPELAAAFAETWETRNHSIVSVGIRAGMSIGLSRLLALLVAATLLAVSIHASRRGADGVSFGTAIAGGLCASPIVHHHYLFLLVIALAVRRPRADWSWLAVTLLWLSPTEPVPDAWRAFAAAAVSTVLIIAIALPQRSYRTPMADSAARKPAASNPALG